MKYITSTICSFVLLDLAITSCVYAEPQVSRKGNRIIHRPRLVQAELPEKPTRTLSQRSLKSSKKSKSESTSPIVDPTASPSANPTVSPTAAPHVTSNPIRFQPIKGTNGAESPDFYYYKSDDYGYTDDKDDDNDDNADQIDNIKDFRVIDNGAMRFGYPWGCTPRLNCEADRAYFQIFDHDNDENPLKADGKVFVKENASDKSIMVSWEGVRGKLGNGDVNVQAQLFANGNFRVCFGSGSLPAGLDLDMMFKPGGKDDKNDPGQKFGPANTSIWPANQCFNFSPGAVMTRVSLELEGCKCSANDRNNVIVALNESLNDQQLEISVENCSTNNCDRSTKAGKSGKSNRNRHLDLVTFPSGKYRHLEDSQSTTLIIEISSVLPDVLTVLKRNLGLALQEVGLSLVEVESVTPTRTPSTGSTTRPTVSPTTMPTKAPSVSPTRSPTASPTAAPTKAPTTSPTRSPTARPTAAPTKAPTARPTKAPTARPTKAPTARPTKTPTARPTKAPPTARPTKPPTTSPNTTPSIATPTTGPPTANPTATPTASPVNTSCVHDAIFEPIKDTVGAEIPDFYYYNYYEDDAIRNDDYGYTDDRDDMDEDYDYNQIPNIDDFRVIDNGAMRFGYPWGCTPQVDCEADRAYLEIFDSDNVQNPLKADGKVFVKEDTSNGSLMVSWEGVQGKLGNGDVNVQARLSADGSFRVCFGCGSLPDGLALSMLFKPGGMDDVDLGVSFGPGDTDVWPENQCFDWS